MKLDNQEANNDRIRGAVFKLFRPGLITEYTQEDIN